MNIDGLKKSKSCSCQFFLAESSFGIASMLVVSYCAIDLLVNIMDFVKL